MGKWGECDPGQGWGMGAQHRDAPGTGPGSPRPVWGSDRSRAAQGLRGLEAASLQVSEAAVPTTYSD